MSRRIRTRSNIPGDFRRIDSSAFSTRSPTHLSKRKVLTKSFGESERKSIILRNSDTSHWDIKKSTLEYNASKRISQLAKPKHQRNKVMQDLESEFYVSNVSPKALNYRPTQRILELSRPKDYIYDIFNKL